jgi:type III restriction enzyme
MERAITEVLCSYQIERHIRRDRDEGLNRLKKSVQLSPEFAALWEKIKPKTTFRVEFSTDELVTKAVSALRRMEKIEPAVVNFDVAALDLTKAGITAKTLRTTQETIRYTGGLPDLLAYLQNETELTAQRSFVSQGIRPAPGFLLNPQRFMDGVASVLKYELHRLLVDGINPNCPLGRV